MNNQQLSNNTLALIALCNEYRQSAEQARDLSRDGFIDAVLRLLPCMNISEPSGLWGTSVTAM